MNIEHISFHWTWDGRNSTFILQELSAFIVLDMAQDQQKTTLKKTDEIHILLKLPFSWLLFLNTEEFLMGMYCLLNDGCNGKQNE